MSLKTEINQVYTLRENNHSFNDIAKEMGFSERTARRRYEAALLKDAIDIAVDMTAIPTIEPLEITVDSDYIPENKKPIERFKPIVRTGDAIVTCDWHIPLHKPELINHMINYIKKHNIPGIIVGGDFLNMDSFSSFAQKQDEADLETERKDAITIVKTLLRSVEWIDFIWGNHEFRLSKRTGFSKSFTDTMKYMLAGLTEDELKKIRFSDLDHMYYYPEGITYLNQRNKEGGIPKGRKFRICHPENFSSQPLVVARKLAQKYDCSIVCAHSHHLAMGFANNGRDIVIDGGGFYDKDRTEYVQRTNTHHEWTPGFFMFKDGVPHMVSPLLNNEKV